MSRRRPMRQAAPVGRSPSSTAGGGTPLRVTAAEWAAAAAAAVVGVVAALPDRVQPETLAGTQVGAREHAAGRVVTPAGRAAAAAAAVGEWREVREPAAAAVERGWREVREPAAAAEE